MMADQVADKLVRDSTRTYQDRAERVAMRCALGDAAALCDALARDIAAENRGYPEGADYMDLGTSEDDVAARSLYESLGFNNTEGKPGGPVNYYYEREL